MPIKERSNDLNQEHIYKHLVIVAVPIALQSLIGSSLNFLDNWMVGRLGEAELYAVGIAIQIYFVHWMVLFGFTSGSATFMAQFFGAKDMSGIRKTTGFAMIVTMAVSLVFFCVAFFFPEYVMRVFTDFPGSIALGAGFVRMGAPTFLLLAISVPLTAALRATQQTKYPMYASVTAFVLNTVLNYFLIFGNFGAPKLGIIGAALATVISRTVELLIILFIIFARKNMVAGKLREFFSFSREFALRIVKNALPTTVNETFWGIGAAMYMAAFARIGETEGAAIQACYAINGLFIMAGFSLGDATLILVGQKLGENRPGEAYRIAGKILKLAVVVGIIAGALLILSGQALLGFFPFTPKGAHLAFLILVVYGSTMWMCLFNGTCIVGVLRCGGDTRFAMKVELFTMWCIGVPLAFLSALVFHWPIYLAVLAVKTDEVVKLIILARRYLSKKWANNMICGMGGK